jgi:hypothetical protein
LDEAAIPYEEVSRKERWELARAWRETFAAELHRQLGVWTFHGYEWHVFSWNHYPSQRGGRALARYRSLPRAERSILVASARSSEDFMLRCPSARPVFREPALDLLVFPDTLRWTAAFPHEVDSGPYLAWAGAFDDPGGSR